MQKEENAPIETVRSAQPPRSPTDPITAIIRQDNVEQWNCIARSSAHNDNIKLIIKNKLFRYYEYNFEMPAHI